MNREKVLEAARKKWAPDARQMPRRRAIAPMAHRELRPEDMHFGTIIGSLDFPQLAVLVLAKAPPTFNAHGAEWLCLVLDDTPGAWEPGAIATFAAGDGGLTYLGDASED